MSRAVKRPSKRAEPADDLIQVKIPLCRTWIRERTWIRHRTARVPMRNGVLGFTRGRGGKRVI